MRWGLVLLALGLLSVAVTFGRFRVSFLIGILWIVALFTAERGLHDRLAGTWLVPR